MERTNNRPNVIEVYAKSKLPYIVVHKEIIKAMQIHLKVLL
jgi:hypothetical protein